RLLPVDGPTTEDAFAFDQEDRLPRIVEEVRPELVSEDPSPQHQPIVPCLDDSFLTGRVMTLVSRITLMSGSGSGAGFTAGSRQPSACVQTVSSRGPGGVQAGARAVSRSPGRRCRAGRAGSVRSARPRP